MFLKTTLTLFPGLLLLSAAALCGEYSPLFEVENGVLDLTLPKADEVKNSQNQCQREAAEDFTAEQRAWMQVIQDSLPDLEQRAIYLASLFPIKPFAATIVAGNRGSSDGFGWVPNYIGINLEEFHKTYGPPD